MGEFTTTIAGATRRQKEIKTAAKWLDSGAADFHLVAEPDNPHDANAIRVEAERKKTFGTERTMIGYLPATVAARVKGRVADLKVVDAYNREPDEEFDFWNIALTIDDPNLSGDKFRDQGRRPKEKRQPIGCGGAIIIVGTLFVVAMCVTDDGPPTARPTPAATSARPAATDDGKRWATLSTTSNVRSGPGTDYPVVKTLNEGERYRCFPPAASDTWVKCFEGQYIHRTLVTFDR